MKGIINTEHTRLRAKPWLGDNVKAIYPAGTVVEIIEHGEEFHKVKIKSRTGYMMAALIEEVADEERDDTDA